MGPLLAEPTEAPRGPLTHSSSCPLLHLRLHRCRPAYTPTMIQRQTLAALLVLAAPACSLRFSSSAPTRRTAVAPAAQSAGLSTAARRQVLLSAAAVATVSALPPQRALATCSCPKGFDSCVCTDDDGPATSSTNKKRADAAGRDAQASQADIAEMREMYGDEPKKASKPSKPSKTSNGGASSTSRSAAPAQLGAPMATPVMPEYAGLSGGGSMNYNEGENEGPAYVMHDHTSASYLPMRSFQAPALFSSSTLAVSAHTTNPLVLARLLQPAQSTKTRRGSASSRSWRRRWRSARRNSASSSISTTSSRSRVYCGISTAGRRA